MPNDKDKSKIYGLVIANTTGIPAALDQVEQDTGIKPLKYIRRAVAESLYNDGYLATIPPDDLRFGPKLDKKKRK